MFLNLVELSRFKRRQVKHAEFIGKTETKGPVHAYNACGSATYMWMYLYMFHNDVMYTKRDLYSISQNSRRGGYGQICFLILFPAEFCQKPCCIWFSSCI